MSAEHRYYGFAIAAPEHEWPFYASGAGWHPTPVTAASEAITVSSVDKIIPVTAFSGVASATLRWRYRMGAGLGALELECEH